MSDPSPTAAPSAAHPDAYSQTGKKSTKATEANGSSYSRSPAFSSRNKTKVKKPSKLDSFKSSWTDPYIRHSISDFNEFHSAVSNSTEK